MKAREYLMRKGAKGRKNAINLERKNWHLTQILGAILYSSEDPEKGFAFPERDALSVDPGDVEFKREVDDKGQATVIVRIRDMHPKSDLTAAESVAQH